MEDDDDDVVDDEDNEDNVDDDDDDDADDDDDDEDDDSEGDKWLINDLCPFSSEGQRHPYLLMELIIGDYLNYHFILFFTILWSYSEEGDIRLFVIIFFYFIYLFFYYYNFYSFDFFATNQTSF